MANTFTQLLYHLVFSVKNRERVIEAGRRDDLYGYLWGISQNLQCHLYRIGGVEDHIHICVGIHKTVAVADYVEKMKTGSSNWIRRESIYPNWPGWQDGYGAFTLAHSDKDAVIDYIKTQQEHHRTVSFIEEYKRLLVEAGIPFEEKYLV